MDRGGGLLLFSIIGSVCCVAASFQPNVKFGRDVGFPSRIDLDGMIDVFADAPDDDAEALLENLESRLNSVTEELLKSDPDMFYESHIDDSDDIFWHSYVLGSGFSNREEINITQVMRMSSLERKMAPEVRDLKELDIAGQKCLLGLTSRGIGLYTLKGSVSDGYSASYKETVLSHKPQAFTAFTRWNPVNKIIEGNVAVAISSPAVDLIWFKVIDGKMIPKMVTWQIHREVTLLKVIKIDEQQVKLVAVTTPPAGEPPHQNTANVYDVEFHDEIADFWLTHKLSITRPTGFDVSSVNENYFLAIAESVPDNTEILKYNVVERRFKSFQNISSKGVTDVKMFRVGFQNYLALGGISPTLYHFNGAEFSLKQSFNTGTISTWLPVHLRTYRDEVMLIGQTANKTNPLVFFLWHEKGFREQMYPICVDEYGQAERDLSCILDDAVYPDLEGTAAISNGKGVVLFFPCEDGQTRVIRIETELIPVPSPLYLENLKILKDKARLEGIFKRQEEMINSTVDKFGRSLKRDDNNFVTGTWHLTGDLEAKSIILDSTSVRWDDLEFGKHEWTSDDLETSVEELQESLKGLSISIEETKAKLEDVVTLDEDVVFISGKKTITGAVDVKGMVKLGDANIKEINGQEWEELFKGTVRLDNTRKIEGEKTFTSLEVESLVTKSINGVDGDKFVYTNEENIINGNLAYKEALKVSGDVTLPDGGMVNGLDLSEDILSLKDTFEHLEFEDLVVDDAYVKTLNGLEITEDMFDKYLSKTRDQKLECMLKADSLHIEGNLELEQLGEINLKDAEAFVSKEKDEVISGTTVLKKGCQINELEADYINNQKMEEFVTKDGDHIITGQKEFTGTVKTDVLEVEGEVDGVDVKELVTLSEDQVIDGKVSFEDEVQVVGDVQVDGEHVDGVHLDKFLPQETLIDSNEVGSDVTFEGELEIGKELEIEKDTEGHGSVKDILADLLCENDEEWVVGGQVIFQGDVTVESNLDVETLNGLKVEDFVTTDGEQVITGNKEFGGKVTFGTLDTNKIDGVDIGELNEKCLKTDGEGFKGSKFIFDTLDTRDLITKKMNGYTEDDYAMTDKDQEFEGNLEFSSLSADYLRVEGDIVGKGLVSGLDLTSLDKMFTLSKPQKIYEDFTFDSVVIDGDLKTDVINGHVISKLEESLLLKEKESQTITAPYKIETLNVAGSVTTEGVWGYNLEQVAENAIWLEKNGEVYGRMSVQDLEVKSLEVKGQLAKLLELLVKEGIKKGDSGFEVTGLKRFVNGVVVKDLNAGLVNGRNFAEDLFTKSSNQEITGIFKFSSIHVDGNMDAEGKVNGYSISDIKNRYYWKDDLHYLIGNSSFSGYLTIEELFVKGKVYEIDFEDFLANTVRVNENVEIDGLKIFTGKVLFKYGLDIEETLNGIDLSEFAEEIVKKNEDAVLRGLITFEKQTTATGLVEVTKDMDVNTIKYCDLDEWKKNAIPLKDCGEVTGPKVFSDIIVKGDIAVENINDIDFESIILASTDEDVLAYLKFEEIHLDSDLDVGELVNEVDLKKEYEDTLLTEGDQVITGSKRFKGSVKVAGDLYVDLVNDKPFSKDSLVPLDIDQDLKGPLLFYGGLKVEKDLGVSGKICGIKIANLVETAVTTNDAQTISGKWTVDGNVSFAKDVIGKGTLDSVDLEELLEMLRGYRHSSSEVLENLQVDYDTVCNDVKGMVEQAKNQPFILKSFKTLQVIDIPRVSSIHFFQILDRQFLAISRKYSCTTLILEWNEKYGSFEVVADVEVGLVSMWNTFYLKDSIYLVTASIKGAETCSYKGCNIWELKTGKTFSVEHKEDLGECSDMIVQTKDRPVVYLLDGNYIKELYINDNGNTVPGESWKMEKDGHTFNLMRSSESEHFAVKSASSLSLFERGSSSLSAVTKFGGDNGYSPVVSDFVTFEAAQQHWLALSLHEKAVIGGEDLIRIYRNFSSGILYQQLCIERPGSLAVLPLDNGAGEDVMLAVTQAKKEVLLYRYKGLAGFVKEACLSVEGHDMYTFRLAVKGYSNSLLCLAVVSEERVTVLLVEMDGDPLSLKEAELDCNLPEHY